LKTLKRRAAEFAEMDFAAFLRVLSASAFQPFSARFSKESEHLADTIELLLELY
jgi:hypothetical protein